MDVPYLKRFKLWIVHWLINGLNLVLNLFVKVLFFKPTSAPRNILIYKVGNIGDIVCAIPSFIAIRRAYPSSRITLFTSPGKKGMLGAKELLKEAWYLDELKIYYVENVDSWKKKIDFTNNLRKCHYDLFIQLPDDLANLRMLLRNLIFAKSIGVESAFGFKIRTIQLFKKTQVDYSSQRNEVESLLDILRENGIPVQKAEFDFNISEEQKSKIKKLAKNKWEALSEKNLIVAINPGGKREANQWPARRFNEVAKHLQNKYNAKIIIIGGKEDVPKAKIISRGLNRSSLLVAAGKIGLLETLELLSRCTFLISNDTGAIHLAAAIGIPVVGLYGVRNVLGRWLPYGSQHKILYHTFLNCNYRQEDCIKKSTEMISVEGVIKACNQLIRKL